MLRNVVIFKAVLENKVKISILKVKIREYHEISYYMKKIDWSYYLICFVISGRVIQGKNIRLNVNITLMI